LNQKSMPSCRVNELPSRVILWGGTGQAKAVRPIIEYFGARVIAVFDDTPNLSPPFSDIELHLGRKAFPDWIEKQQRDGLGFCIAIGNPHGRVRLTLHEMLVNEGLAPVTIAHPTAWIAANAEIGVGSQILAGAIIGAEARLGRQCIVNSHALVEHEASLSDAVEIAPSATVLGLTQIGVNTLVGASATILSRLTIGSDVMIGAGAIISTDIRDKEIIHGQTKRPL